MEEKVFLFFKDLFAGKYENVAFLVVAILLSVIIVINLTLSTFKKGYSIKKRTFFFLINLPFCFLCLVFFRKYKLELIVLFLCYAFLGFLPLLFIRTKAQEEPKKIEEIINLAIKTAKDNDKPITKSSKIVETLRVAETKKPSVERADKPDFSHVKNVLERLWEYPLTAGDKKQLKDVENAIILMENGEESCYELNDELGALLKIMSKYGV